MLHPSGISLTPSDAAGEGRAGYEPIVYFPALTPSAFSNESCATHRSVMYVSMARMPTLCGLAERDWLDENARLATPHD